MRSYRQYCPLARALDRIGERWTLLIVRDLSAGPKRYSDLHAGLPGIGTTLLADRLRQLEDDGVVARVELPPPAASTVFELTEAGEQLAAALAPLTTWGMRYLDDIGEDEIRPEWIFMFWQSQLDRDAARDVRDLYEFRIGAQSLHVCIHDGELTAASTPAPRPADVVITTDWVTFFDIGAGTVSPAEAVADGRLRVDGDPDAAQRCYDLLGRAPMPFAAHVEAAKQP